MERPLDPGYAAAADRREAAGMPRSTGVDGLRLTVAAVVLGLLLGIAAAALNRDAPEVTRTKQRLIDQIDAARRSADARTVTVGKLQGQIRAVESRHGEDLAGQLAGLEAETGVTPVSGPGLVLTLDDAPGVNDPGSGSDPRTSSAVDGGTVLAKDVQVVSNALWEAGAEAMSINGHRLSSRSAIRFAGDAILVNFRPLTRPYVIEAIGDPATLEANLADSAGGAYLEALKSNFGIQVSRSGKDRITMAGATSLTVQVATPLYPSGDASATTAERSTK